MADNTLVMGDAHQTPSACKLVCFDRMYASGNWITHWVVMVSIMVVTMLPAARNTPITVIWMPMKPQARAMILRKCAEAAITPGSLGTKKAENSRANTKTMAPMTVRIQ